MIGNYEIKREGVGVEDAKEILLTAMNIKNRTNSDGSRSRYYYGKKCGVTINPDTGTMIQANPM